MDKKKYEAFLPIYDRTFIVLKVLLTDKIWTQWMIVFKFVNVTHKKVACVSVIV